MAYWLLKSEPDVFSISDLRARPKRTAAWDGVRNYQARNFLRAMRVGDEGFFYHSSCPEPGIVGIVRVVREAYPDDTAFDPHSPQYDPRSDRSRPRWYMVDVRIERAFPRTLSLRALKEERALADMPLLRRGNRLSVMPVTAAQWSFILSLLP